MASLLQSARSATSHVFPLTQLRVPEGGGGCSETLESDLLPAWRACWDDAAITSIGDAGVCLLLLKDQACKVFFGEFLPQQ